MKEYTFVLLMLAGMVTLAAFAFGLDVYFKCRYGAHTLKFELLRIVIIWITVIALLLMIGLLVATVAGWTAKNVADAFDSVLEWARQNRIMAEILLCGVTILLIMLLVHVEVFTVSSYVVISLLHVWATYAIWNSDTAAPWQFIWMFAKIVVAIIFAGVCDDESAFDILQPRKRDGNDIGDGHNDSPARPISAQSDDTDAPQNAIEAIAETIAQHVDPIVQTVQD